MNQEETKYKVGETLIYMVHDMMGNVIRDHKVIVRETFYHRMMSLYNVELEDGTLVEAVIEVHLMRLQ